MRSRAIESYKETLKLSDEQREILVGLLLGDACLETQNRGLTYRLKIEQSAQHQEYVNHLYLVFQSWVLSPPREKGSVASTGTATISWAFSTVSHSAFRFYAQQFYVVRKKRVPELIHRWLTPRGLAYWFMDDGSLKSKQSKGVIFNTQGFDRGDVERLIEVLRQHFLLKASLRRQADGWQIYVSGSSYEEFVKLVEPCLQAGMRYKLPPARRTRLPKE